MSAINAYLNFLKAINAIVPTATGPDKRFQFYTPAQLDPDSTDGATRLYTIFWDGSGADQEPTDITERVAEHSFTVEVAYSTASVIDGLMQLIVSDRHDLAKALRTPDGFTGTEDDAAANTGIWSRIRASDELDRSGTHTWYLRQTWRCTLREAE